MGNHDTHGPGAEDVEEKQAIDESAGCFGDVTARSFGFTSGHGDEFRREDEREAGFDKGIPEPKEPASISTSHERIESSRSFPVAEAETVMVRSTSEEEDNSENDQTDNRQDLDRGEPELSLSEKGDRNDVE